MIAVSVVQTQALFLIVQLNTLPVGSCKRKLLPEPIGLGTLGKLPSAVESANNDPLRQAVVDKNDQDMIVHLRHDDQPLFVSGSIGDHT